jgi:hypothetical protein
MNSRELERTDGRFFEGREVWSSSLDSEFNDSAFRGLRKAKLQGRKDLKS